MRDDVAFAMICPHCDRVIKETVEQIIKGPIDNFRAIDKSAGIYESRCPYCDQWYRLDDLDTASMIEDGTITDTTDYGPTEFEKEQVHKFNQKIANGEVPKPWFPAQGQGVDDE